jgi:hypothetical protein
MLEKILLDYTNAFVQSAGQIVIGYGMAGMLPFDQISKEDLGSGMARIIKYGAGRILTIL